MPRTSTRMRGCALHEIEAARLRGCKRDLPGAARYRAWKCWMSSARLPARKRARRIEHQTRVGSCTHLSGAGRRLGGQCALILSKPPPCDRQVLNRSAEHTSELQSLMRISYAD